MLHNTPIQHTTTMNYTAENLDDRELLVKLNHSLQTARLEEKRAVQRVHRLETQCQMVAERLEVTFILPATSTSNFTTASTFNSTTSQSTDFTELKNEVRFRNTPTRRKSHFLDTSTATMLPSGWSKAFDDKQQKFYFYHSENNVVQWNAPGLESPPSNNNSRPVSPNFTSNESLHSNRRINEFKSVNKRRGSVYDKLTDYSLYTGSSKNRFDNTGHGIPETEVVTTTATNGIKGQQRVRRQSHYSGSTNTKSDEIFHDASEFLVRNDHTAPVGGRWR